MTVRAYRGPIDYERLGRYFRALSVPSRVLLLQLLQVPRTPSEIELPAFRRAREHRDDRIVSRQTVESHLKKLETAGLVRSRPAERDGQRVREYIVNAPRLFVVTDELRRLSLIQPAPGTAREWTTQEQGTHDATNIAELPPMPETPALVLASGPYEGRAFALEGPGPWTLGRAEACDVSLTFDPFVSSENCRIVRDDVGLILHSAPGATNGTTVNWRHLRDGGSTPLKPGDTIGVGRTLLVFREG